MLSSVLALAFCSAQPRDVLADSLTLLAKTGENNFSIINCSSNSAPKASCGSAIGATASGSLSTGTLGSLAQVTSAPPNELNQTNWVAQAQGTLDYVYTVTGTQTGTIDTTLTVDGNTQVTSSSPCGAPSCYAFGAISIASTESFGGSFTGVLPNGQFTFSIITPVINGTADFNFSVDTMAVCPPVNLVTGFTCTASADYLDPVMITGASVFDANGNLVRDATIVSESGYKPPSSTSTPEPASILLLATGALAFPRLLRRKRV